jgi:hypothetical protein
MQGERTTEDDDELDDEDDLNAEHPTLNTAPKAQKKPERRGMSRRLRR